MSTLDSSSLPSILAAMDAVDAARGMEAQLDDAINLDARKAALKAKLRQTYADQSITVSDEVLDKGVDEFFAQRFVFRPLAAGVTKVLAWAYLKRVRIAQIVGAVALVIACTVGFVHLNQAMVKSYREHAEAQRIADAKALVIKVEADRVAAIRAEEDRVTREAAAAKARAAQLAALPGAIQATGDAALSVAKEPDVSSRIAALATSGISAAKSGDLTGANAFLNELRAILADLSTEYEVRINLSGKKGGANWVTGGWREFRGNRRYYVVVNASHNGSAVPVTVRNEETGETANLTSWAEQVTQSTFEAIRAEKSSRGTLHDDLFARKDRGYLTPSYLQGFKAGQGPANTATYRITRW